MMAKENKRTKTKTQKKAFISQFHHQKVWCILTDRQKGSFIILSIQKKRKKKTDEWKKIKKNLKYIQNDK